MLQLNSPTVTSSENCALLAKPWESEQERETDIKKKQKQTDKQGTDQIKKAEGRTEKREREEETNYSKQKKMH